jgi:hypothetical protein
MLENLKEEMELWKLLGYGFWEYFVDYMHNQKIKVWL